MTTDAVCKGSRDLRTDCGKCRRCVLELEARFADALTASQAREEGLKKDRTRLNAELARWHDYYGCESPEDGVIGTAAGKICGEHMRTINGLRAELAALRERLAQTKGT